MNCIMKEAFEIDIVSKCHSMMLCKNQEPLFILDWDIVVRDIFKNYKFFEYRSALFTRNEAK